MTWNISVITLNPTWFNTCQGSHRPPVLHLIATHHQVSPEERRSLSDGAQGRRDMTDYECVGWHSLPMQPSDPSLSHRWRSDASTVLWHPLLAVCQPGSHGLTLTCTYHQERANVSTGTTLKVRSNSIHVYTIWGKFNIKLSLGLIEHNLVLKPAVSMFGCETRKWAGRAWVGHRFI